MIKLSPQKEKVIVMTHVLETYKYLIVSLIGAIMMSILTKQPDKVVALMSYKVSTLS